MTTVRCPSCGHTHNVPDTENERLRLLTDIAKRNAAFSEAHTPPLVAG